ncbi:PstS family phosphate ABC transporter substrate-binding protein [Metabacillus halosaccharovorans]|uniref:PstS family phosphate ABC transporter substrate-binding protein n=1 Tax=Metabacillus halosaccharovorans TaxID=930124 RepID=UPI00203D6370|nr:PstS family phosphate ABC transporter substrate-binding protein [Metabacillus halosaccharovorans]MCM3442117.1 PstS family phosphate ABC transporter substrate-binding protein [Metabacillus halosaccharovorans]
MKSFKSLVLLLVMGILVVFAAACGNGASTEGDSSTGSGDSNEEETALEGSVVIDGSGTVYPFMAKMAENYMTENEEVSVEVSRAGTSAGFEKFLAENGTDFNDASREIKEEETAKAEELGIEVKEFQVALDGLTFVINKENDWATEMTQEEVVKIFLAEGGVTKWSDINPEWPAEEIKPMGPNENHGTNEFMFETIMEEKDFVDSVNLQQEYSTLVDLVSKDKNAIAFFGYGYYDSNKDKLNAVNVDFGNGPVAPSLETIGLGEEAAYNPFTRPVFTYLNVGMAKEKPQVLDYAIYTMENAQDVAAETGFAPLKDEVIQESISYLEGLK